MEFPLAIALISFVTTFALALLMMRWSPKLGLLDLPGARKVHADATPYGGLAVVGGVLVGSLILLPMNLPQLGWLLGGIGMALIGLADDKFDLSPGMKLLGQTLSSLAPILLTGFGVYSINLVGIHFDLGILAIPFSLLWIVGITNAFNLIDGLDGLAIGTAAIAASALFIVNLQTGNDVGLILSAGLVGGAIGFVLFNAHPARLFLGDGGSYFVGYLIAILSVISFQAEMVSFARVPIHVIALILFYPIADTLWAIIRRMLAGRSIFSPDQQHFHHQVIKLKWDYGVSVFALYLLIFLTSLLALIIYLT